MLKMLALLLLSILVGCGPALAEPPSPSSQSAAEPPAKPQPPPKPEADPSRNEQRVPTAWVRIVNRKTGKVIRLNAHPVQIEPAGEFYKLRSQDGRYVVLALGGRMATKALCPPGYFAMGRTRQSPSRSGRSNPVAKGFGPSRIARAKNACVTWEVSPMMFGKRRSAKGPWSKNGGLKRSLQLQ